jgi:hypothetical protein
MIVLNGKQGKQVVVDGATVKIIKKGSLLASKREKTLPIRNISSVEVKKPGALITGFIQFSIAGGKARDSSHSLTGGAWDAIQDENSVVFSDITEYETALEIKKYVENFSDSPMVTAPSNNSSADEIVKFKNLLDQGIITQQEFDAKKRQLLGL